MYEVDRSCHESGGGSRWDPNRDLSLNPVLLQCIHNPSPQLTAFLALQQLFTQYQGSRIYISNYQLRVLLVYQIRTRLFPWARSIKNFQQFSESIDTVNLQDEGHYWQTRVLLSLKSCEYSDVCSGASRHQPDILLKLLN